MNTILGARNLKIGTWTLTHPRVIPQGTEFAGHNVEIAVPAGSYDVVMHVACRRVDIVVKLRGTVHSNTWLWNEQVKPGTPTEGHLLPYCYIVADCVRTGADWWGGTFTLAEGWSVNEEGRLVAPTGETLVANYVMGKAA